MKPKEDEMKGTEQKRDKDVLADEQRTLRELVAQLPLLAGAMARANRDQHRTAKRGRLHAV